MNKLLAALSVLTIIAVAPATVQAMTDDSAMSQPEMTTMSAPTNNTQLTVTPDDGSGTRAQGSQLQPAGTGTDSVPTTSGQPDMATQNYMAGESVNQPSSKTADIETDSVNNILSPVVVGLATALVVAAGVLTAMYVWRRSR